MDIQKIIEILEANREKEFVKRILSPNEYPQIPNEDGTLSTHLMSWSGPDEQGTSYVYPTIIYRNGRLERLAPQTAYRYARDSKEYIPFTNPNEADSFSKEYKNWWDGGYRQP